MYERLKQLQRKAYYYNGEIRSMKGMLKACWEKGKDPLDINDWQSYSPCTGFHEEEQECDLYSYQKYYAYLLYFRKLLQITETEIRKEKAKIVQAQRANLPTKVYKNKVQVFEGTKRPLGDRPITPIIRKVDDFMHDRQLNDRITYVVGEENVEVRFFDRDKKIKGKILNKEEVETYAKEHYNGL